MAAILDSLGFTFLIDRMTEVLTPDIYIELTGMNSVLPFSKNIISFKTLKISLFLEKFPCNKNY
jgi:hypothetical protein